MRQLLSITIRGDEHTWSFNFKGNPDDIVVWRADGLEVYEVGYIVPQWAVALGLLRPWMAVQDAWRFLRFW